MFELIFAIAAFAFIFSAYCYFLSQDNKNIKELLKKIEEDHDNDIN